MTGYMSPESYLDAFRRVGTPDQFAEGLSHVLRARGEMEDHGQRISALEGALKGVDGRLTGVEHTLSAMAAESARTSTQIVTKIDALAAKVDTVQTTQTLEAGRRQGAEDAAKNAAALALSRGAWARTIVPIAWALAAAIGFYAFQHFIRETSGVQVRTIENMEIGQQ